MAGFFNEFWGIITTTISNFSLIDALDIFCVTAMFYLLIKFIRDTRAVQLIKGIVLIIAILLIAKLINLAATEYILSSCLEFGFLAIIIVFQPEMRSVLERMGRKGRFSNLFFGADDEAKKDESTAEMITNITKAISNFSATKTGALIVIERQTKLGEIVDTGVKIDAGTAPELIMNIFFNKAPLHDGAAIIRENRIIAAGCYLPLTSDKLDTELGTRHRAGLGMSENSDAINIIVSEETGIISLAIDGKLTRRITPDVLSATLKKLLLQKKNETKKDLITSLWKGRDRK